MQNSPLNVGIIGGSKAGPKALDLAYLAGQEIARRNWVLYCGGRGGIMKEASRGANEAGGVVIGILPGFTRGEANPFVTYSIPTGLGHLRNQIIVCSSDVILAFEGSMGTLSEIALANIYKRPVLSIGAWALPDDPVSGQPVYQGRYEEPGAAFEWIEDWSGSASG